MDYNHVDWSPENYVVEVMDCLLKRRGYDSNDDVIAVIGRAQDIGREASLGKSCSYTNFLKNLVRRV